MAKMGRKNAYETVIKPRFSEIIQWMQQGATEKQVAHNLGIARSTFNKYKAEEKDFADILQKGRESLVLQLRGALVKKAMGFEYEEKKIVRRKDPDGTVTETVEVYVKKSPPDVAAANLCLKNYDPNAWANDPQMLALRREELELKKQQVEKEMW